MITIQWQDPITQEQMRYQGDLPIVIGRTNCDINLTSHMISSYHARLAHEEGQVVLVDLNSKNGTLIDGEPIHRVILAPHQPFQVGPYLLAWQPKQEKVFPPTSFEADIVPMHTLTGVEETTYVSIGGGIGSFVWVDHLLVHGATQDQVTVIGFEANPYGRYRRLCQNSQIPEHERLRSNSDSCPDNLWGWPGYGVREMWTDVKQGQLGHAAKIGWQLFNEPFVQTYTPKAGDVFESIDREAERIGWHSMWRQGRVRAVRKTDDGRYAIAYSHLNGTNRHRVIVAKHVHIAVGYPGVRFLPDLQAYREETADFQQVVNAYENHDHVYDTLQKNGGVVIIRGRGIVASRILQRIYEVRQTHNAPLYVVHLMRSRNEMGNRYGMAERDVNNHWEFQPFNWPKAAWGGDLRGKLEQASTQTQGQLLQAWGGTTTADRADWRDIVQMGLDDGWYQIQFGTVADVRSHPSGRIATQLEDGTIWLSDFIVDATGLESGIDGNSLLKDLVEQYQLPRNAQNRLKVTPCFELEQMRNGSGRVYASGIITLGGPYAAVDSFLGLQYAALRSVNDLVALGAPRLHALNGFRSVGQWARWARGVQP